MKRINMAIQVAVETLGLEIDGVRVISIEARHLRGHWYGVRAHWSDEITGESTRARVRIAFSNDFSKCEVTRQESWPA